MKSFNSFIYESDSPNNWEHTEEDYMHTIDMILSEDPFVSQYGMQELDVLYEEEDKKKIAIMLVNIIKSKWGKFSNTYEMLILLESAGIVDLLNFKGSQFEDQFILRTAENDSFYNIFNRKTLDLNLTQIATGIFKGLKNVESIHINSGAIILRKGQDPSKVITINKELFKDCENLESISILSFEIDKIEQGAFLNNTKLASINIDNCGLKNIEVDAFSSNSIKEITLHECDLENLESEIFTKCINLKILNLAANNLTRIPKLSNTLLEEFYLNHNHIDTIEPEVFSNLKNLKALELSSNPIKRIQEKSFLGLSNLSDLALAYLPKGCSIDPGAFFKLEDLTNLDLIDTKLDEVTMGQLESELPGKTDIMFELPF